MKIFLVALCLAVTVTAARAQDVDRERADCKAWQEASRNERLAFIIGWLRAIEFVDGVLGSKTGLWPRGHRVASVILEMDVECAKPERRNADLAVMMKFISDRLNHAN